MLLPAQRWLGAMRRPECIDLLTGLTSGSQGGVRPVRAGRSSLHGVRSARQVLGRRAVPVQVVTAYPHPGSSATSTCSTRAASRSSSACAPRLPLHAARSGQAVGGKQDRWTGHLAVPRRQQAIRDLAHGGRAGAGNARCRSAAGRPGTPARRSRRHGAAGHDVRPGRSSCPGPAASPRGARDRRASPSSACSTAPAWAPVTTTSGQSSVQQLRRHAPAHRFAVQFGQLLDAAEAAPFPGRQQHDHRHAGGAARSMHRLRPDRAADHPLAGGSRRGFRR